MNGGFVLGLTGKSGAGKNLAAAFLEKSGWIHFDTDKEAHRVLDGACKEAAQLFGREILTERLTERVWGKLSFHRRKK